jgi:hypothetical protein
MASKHLALRVFVRGAYDMQALRISTGNRISGNFKTKIGQVPGQGEETLDQESKDLLASLRAKFAKITDAIVDQAEKREKEDAVAGDVLKLLENKYNTITEKRKKFPDKKTFKGDPVISDYTELCLVSQYVELKKDEESHFRRLEHVLEEYEIYNKFLATVRGCGPAMSGVILSEIDIHKAGTPSALFKYSGYDVAPDGKGRSRKEEHLIEVAYVDKNGVPATRKSITFNPWLKVKLWVLASSFLRAGNEKYREIYDNYKHRMEHHAVYGVQNDKKKDEKGFQVTSPGRRHNMSIRYMIKMFLIALHIEWRKIEGLPVSLPYSEAVLKHVHKEYNKPK